MIPNVCHFVFGLEPQTEDFLFVHYVAVLSCSVVNEPEAIHFYYHYEPKGTWWEKTKEIDGVKLLRVELPAALGPHPVVRTAHKADVVRMRALYAHGGIYLDIDTICVRPWRDLLDHCVVLGKEASRPGLADGICNAIMLTEPKSRFFAEWIAQYPRFFNPSGWREASIVLPRLIADAQPTWLTLKDPSAFFLPNWDETCKIFAEPTRRIPHDLVALHLWQSYSKDAIKSIRGWEWADGHRDTLYGRLLANVRELAAEGTRALHNPECV